MGFVQHTESYQFSDSEPPAIDFHQNFFKNSSGLPQLTGAGLSAALLKSAVMLKPAVILVLPARFQNHVEWSCGRFSNVGESPGVYDFRQLFLARLSAQAFPYFLVEGRRYADHR